MTPTKPSSPTLDYQTVIHAMKYARVTPEGHRETWDETVDRLGGFLVGQLDNSNALKFLVGTALPMVRNRLVMPSMRLLASAGAAASRENLTVYNCMFLGIDSLKSFGTLMYSLMCGTGVGFSVEHHYTEKLPCVPLSYTTTDKTLVVEDSREGWAKAYLQYLEELTRGNLVTVDYSKVRPKGAPLRVTGGYASGPEPLKELMEFTEGVFLEKILTEETSLTTLDVYDICCKIADVVVQGGVRRSACICLYDYDDPLMSTAKAPGALENNPQRYNCNNTAVYPNTQVFRDNLEVSLARASRTGEPGMTLKSALRTKSERANRFLDDSSGESWGLNPCAEIILRSNQVCNLTEVILSPELSVASVMDQIEAAVFLGILQSRLADFHPELLETVRNNALVEPLLGVSLTGLMDAPALWSSRYQLEWFREYAHKCAKEWWTVLGDERPLPKAITTVKPSGTVSKLVDCSPGVHPRFSKYYLSNLGVTRDTPLDVFFWDSGVPVRHTTDTLRVYSFPLESPEGAVVSEDMSAIEQLQTWKKLNDYWCDHNVSCTVYVEDHEWKSVEDWLGEYAEDLTGLTLLPKAPEELLKSYPYMPYEALDEETYLKATREWPVLNWERFRTHYDNKETKASQEFSCSASDGGCNIEIL